MWGYTFRFRVARQQPKAMRNDPGSPGTPALRSMGSTQYPWIRSRVPVRRGSLTVYGVLTTVSRPSPYRKTGSDSVWPFRANLHGLENHQTILLLLLRVDVQRGSRLQCSVPPKRSSVSATGSPFHARNRWCSMKVYTAPGERRPGGSTRSRQHMTLASCNELPAQEDDLPASSFYVFKCPRQWPEKLAPHHQDMRSTCELPDFDMGCLNHARLA